MREASRDKILRTLMDLIYGEKRPADPSQLLPPAFEELRKLLPFSSAVFMPIDPTIWVLKNGYSHDLDTRTTDTYLEHYVQKDPYVIELPCLKHPNQVIRFSNVADLARLSEGEFGSFMHQVPYFHAIATVPFVRGFPSPSGG